MIRSMHARLPLDPAGDESDFDEDDLDLNPAIEPLDPAALEDDELEPEPEHGDFWPEPDDFED